MQFELLHRRLPKLAEAETRQLTILGGNDGDLPPGTYTFHEMFCDEEGCDCRRVFFYVVSSRRRKLEAVIGYGWEPPEFYAKWMRNPDPDSIADLVGPSLNPLSPQSSLAPALLQAMRDLVLRDEKYVARLARHYRAFKETLVPVPRRLPRRPAPRRRSSAP
jgi:hypothetical protein